MPQDLGRDEEGMVVNSSPRVACGPSENSQRLSIVSVCVHFLEKSLNICKDSQRKPIPRD